MMWGRPSGPLPHSSRPVTMRLVDARGFPGSGPADWAAALWARARAAWVPLAVGAGLLGGGACALGLGEPRRDSPDVLPGPASGRGSGGGSRRRAVGGLALSGDVRPGSAHVSVSHTLS